MLYAKNVTKRPFAYGVWTSGDEAVNKCISLSGRLVTNCKGHIYKDHPEIGVIMDEKEKRSKEERKYNMQEKEEKEGKGIAATVDVSKYNNRGSPL